MRKVDVSWQNAWKHGSRESWQEVPRPHEKLTQVYGKSRRCTESQLILSVGSAAVQIVYGRSCGCMKCLRELMESTAEARKVNGSWHKIPRMYGKMLEIDGKSRCHTESRWKALWKHGKLTEGQRMHKSWRKSTQGPAQSQNVDRRSRGCTESWHKVPQSHRRLIAGTVDTRKVNRRSHGCRECWRKIPWTHGNLTEVDGCSLRVKEICQKFT